VPCFNVSPKHFDRIPEFDRQLAGQQKGLNDLTVDEYLKGREAFTSKDMVRDPKVAKAARVALSTDLETMFRDEYLLEGKLPTKAASLAKEKMLEKMSTLAALHNPDLVVGGKDMIDGFGDRRVNSSIGSQWSSRIKSLDAAANKVATSVRGITKINTKLKRCIEE
ncbi:polymorphic toxin type 15 domain-containing protein, partial [Pseudomonas floridensis]